MNLHHLEIFRCVFETVSMTAAAERLMISQPAVSKQIKELERSLGIPLFVRQTRALTPTPAGHLLAKYARNVNDVVEQAKEAIAALKKGERGRLSLAASTTIGTYIVPRILELFHRDYPDVEISLEVVNTAAAHQLLLDGAVELALTEGFVDRTKLNAEAFIELLSRHWPENEEFTI